MDNNNTESIIVNPETGRQVCSECRAWEHAGDRIVHRKHCDSRLQVSATPEPVAATQASRRAYASKVRETGLGLDDERVYDAYRSGHLSMSDAMNSDD